MVDPPKKNPHADLIMASLQRMAMQMLEVPQSEREGLYEDFRTGSQKDAARRLGLDPKAAEEFGQKYLEFLRALVKIIEAGGGAGGGRA
jgi:hypothetical protein